MAQPHLELHFLGLHHTTSSSTSLPRPRLDRRRSFCGISKINPEIVKSVIANSATKQDPDPDNAFNSSPPTALHLPRLPLCTPLPFLGEGSYEKAPGAAPFTIFYNGAVSVFDLTNDKAQDIIKFAMEKGSSKTELKVHVHHIHPSARNILQPLNDGDLPMKRKKSLQRFFEKRNER